MATLLPEIRRLMAELDLAPPDVDPAAHLVDDLELDSLDLMDLLLRLEEHFDVELRDESLDAVKTVGDVVERVAAACAAREGGARSAPADGG